MITQILNRIRQLQSRLEGWLDVPSPKLVEAVPPHLKANLEAKITQAQATLRGMGIHEVKSLYLNSK